MRSTIAARPVLIVLTLLLSAGRAVSADSAIENNFKTALARAEKEVGEFSEPSALLDSSGFLQIYNDPKPNLRPALDFLSKPEATKNQKLIIAYSMQKLPLNDYLFFVNRLLQLAEHGKIEKRIFDAGAFPTFEWNTLLDEKYKNKKVRDFLLKVKASPRFKKDGDYTSTIDAILSGETAKTIKKMRAAGALQSN